MKASRLSSEKLVKFSVLPSFWPTCTDSPVINCSKINETVSHADGKWKTRGKSFPRFIFTTPECIPPPRYHKSQSKE